MTTNELHSVLRRDVLKTIGLGAAVGAIGFTTMSGRALANGVETTYVLSQRGTEYEVTAVTYSDDDGPVSIQDFYNYAAEPNKGGSNSPIGIEKEDYSRMFLYKDANGLYLVIFHDDNSDDPGNSKSRQALFEFSGLPAAGSWIVDEDNDPNEDSGTASEFYWRWFPEWSDGGAYGLLTCEPGEEFSINVTPDFNPNPEGALDAPTSTDWLQGWEFYNGDGGVITLDETAELTVSCSATCTSSYPLCAGQDIDVGHVTVTNNGTTLDITYDIKEQWLLYETHAHVASDLDGFPVTRQGNPKVGQFDYTAMHDGVSSYTIEDVSASVGDLIATHAVVYRVDCGAEDGPSFWARGVESEELGTKLGGDDLSSERADTTNALDAPDDSFVSLGFNEGYVVVTFDHPVLNGPSDNDIFLSEVTFGRGSYPEELADVYVRPVGESEFVKAGTISNNDNFDGNSPGVGAVSIPDGIVAVDAVKVVNATPQSNFEGNQNADGYDLNAVGANCLTNQNETAWTCDGTRFTERGSWATYFIYSGCE